MQIAQQAGWIQSPNVLYPALLAEIRKCKKLLLNDGDFMNEFKLN